MFLQMNENLSDGYKNNSQKARVITEQWIADNMYYPKCGNVNVSHFENNKPVADFFCSKCQQQYELKSKNGKTISKINDGAYSTMIERITSLENPNFFFMSYSNFDWKISDLIFVPNHFFTPNIIERRKPLAETARRAGWVGCNILLNLIPITGKISIIENGYVYDKENVLSKVKKADKLFTKDINSRGWIFDIIGCIEKINNDEFTLQEVYSFENFLAQLHPENRNLKAKIRQQLQFIRDKGLIEFLGRGKYRKVL